MTFSISYTAFSVNFAMLISSRIIVGLATGMTCISANTFVAEIASADIRGMLGMQKNCS